MTNQKTGKGSAAIGRELTFVNIEDLPPEMRKRITEGICQRIVSTLIEDHKEDLIRQISKNISEEMKKDLDLSEEIFSDRVTVLERIDEEEAKERIRKYLQLKKSKGESKVDDIEIMEELKIPIEQIDEILEKIKPKS